MKSKIIEVTLENIAEHPGAICFINPKNQYYHLKVEWLKEQFNTGLKIKLLYIEGENRPKGFIEYVPGEFCWRPINAKGYMFIHCLWTNGRRYQHQGLGSQLLDEVEKDALGMNGIAVMTSEGSFMAKSQIFLKTGYKLIDNSGKEQLLVKQFKDSPLPSFIYPVGDLKDHTGIKMLYSCQCPWVARFIEEVSPVLKRNNLNPEISKMKNCTEAQQAPTAYGVFNLIYNGRILADRYISVTRFNNILKKTIK